MIGTDTMQQIICTNNQFLRNIVSIPINGLLPTALNAEIDLNENEPKENKTKTTVYDYITDAEWYLGLEPTNCKGQYLLLTTHQQVQEARNWLNKNPEALFTKYITQYQTFTPIKGYDYPKRGNKPRFSHQLGNYANHLCVIYTPPSVTTTTDNTKTKWNKSPLSKTWPHTACSFNFESKQEYPALPTKKAKRMHTSDQKPTETAIPTTAIPTTSNSINAKTLRKQIMANMKDDMTKIICQEVESIHTDFTTQMKALSTNITTNFNTQMAKVIQTIQALNQRFNEVMARLPNNPPMPAHKKSKGLGVDN